MHFFISAASLGFHVLIWCMPALFWLQPSLCRTNLLLQDNEAAALLVTLGLGVCSAVATRGRQSMERNQRRALQQSAVDNSLSTYIPEKDRVQPRTGALSAVKASFGVKGDANSPTRAQLTTPPTHRKDPPSSTSSPKVQPPSSTAQRRAYSFGTAQQSSVEASTGNWEHENGKLYEAYNELHALAQAFQKPFDAPAILVVGHQTDGKSGNFLQLFMCCLRM